MKFSEYEHLIFERRDNGVLLVTMNRPDKYNAANEQMHGELARVWTEVSDDQETKVAVVTGAGRASRPAATSPWSSGWRATTTGWRTCSRR